MPAPARSEKKLRVQKNLRLRERRSRKKITKPLTASVPKWWAAANRVFDARSNHGWVNMSRDQPWNVA